MSEVVRMLQIHGTDQEDPVIFCPGCKCGHLFSCAPINPRWKWNGDKVKPTFAPSMLVNQHDPASRCHSVVTDGMIAFQNDCFHELKGKTVPLQPFGPDDW